MKDGDKFFFFPPSLSTTSHFSPTQKSVEGIQTFLLFARVVRPPRCSLPHLAAPSNGRGHLSTGPDSGHRYVTVPRERAGRVIGISRSCFFFFRRGKRLCGVSAPPPISTPFNLEKEREPTPLVEAAAFSLFFQLERGQDARCMTCMQCQSRSTKRQAVAEAT